MHPLTELVLEGSGGEPLERRIGQLPDVAEFLSLAIAITAAVAQVHAQGLIHKDIKPANILIDPCGPPPDGGRASLTGFGIASRCPRERQIIQPPEALAGTLPYMSPEQTGRMNRSIDSRSDLYSLGVTLYELLTGKLPFSGADPLDWIHCHVARSPASPCDLRPQVPEVIAQVLLKLLAKSADERYQTAAGLEVDWLHCLQEWECKARIDPFLLGEHDAPDHIIIPEKLYGRQRELAGLRAARDEVTTAGAPVLMLLAGYAGVGKSAIVHEFLREFATDSWFATGKCDQYRRDIPYATLMGAFASLVRQLLSLPDREIAQWRERLGEALGGNGRIILDLIPELEPIIGAQPPVAEVPPQDVMNRLSRLVRRFLGAFATAEHPLILFLDDLQWLDAATLELLEHLLSEPEIRHLLLIGAYRDNEVDVVHPLAIKVRALRARSARVHELCLAPLESRAVAQLVGDALHCPHERSAGLADLVHAKTHGNPFFVIQFLTNLEQEGFLSWQGAQRGWSWDTPRIHAQGFTDNVVHLLVGKLGRLSTGTIAALQRLACAGGGADVDMLTKILETSTEAVHEAIAEAVAAGLVMRIGQSYRFVHDRVQESAYSLVPEQEREQLHLRVGRALYSYIQPEQIEEHVFEIVNQLNRAQELIVDPRERRTLAELNLMAGTRARQSGAYAAALNYVVAGSSMLPGDCWTESRGLAFPLEFHRAECEFLTGSLEHAEARLAALTARASGAVEGAAVACLRQMLYAVLGRNDRAVEVCLQYLRQHGIEWRSEPTEQDLQVEYARLWANFEERRAEDLVDLPQLVDPQQRAILDVLASVLAMALMTNGNLFRLVVCRMANMSLQYGNCDGSTLAYTYLNFIVGEQLGDYALGLRFGKLAMALVEKGMRSYKARVEVAYGVTIIPWTQPMRTGLSWVQRSIHSAQEAGDLTFACYSWFLLVALLLRAGEPLADVQQEAERALQLARKLNFGYMIDVIAAQLAFVSALRGLPAEPSSFTHESRDESGYERRLVEEPNLRNAAYMYWGRKQQACFLADDHVSARAAGDRAHEYRWDTLQPFERCDYYFYTALTTEDRDVVAAHGRSLAAMAANSPENFDSRASLVAAELARLEGRDSDAEKSYERAVQGAREAGLIHDEAVALEAAGRHYVARGLETVALGLLRGARSCYERWGATAKVRLLERRYPRLREQSLTDAVGGTVGVPLLDLDAASVIEAAQAVSSEIVPEMLIRRLLTLALKQAGAERGLLILVRDGIPRLEAEARTDPAQNDGSGVVVEVRQVEPTADLLPVSVLQLVLRTQQSISLEDVTTFRSFAGDDYLRRHAPRSILCLPLTRQGRLTGLLYLENRLVAGLFTPSRRAVLEVLAAQAGISLENACLYSDLQERESRIRRLLESNLIGIVFWSGDGAIVDANEAFLRLVRHSRESLQSGQLTWRALTPPEYRDLGRLHEYIRSDGIATTRELELLLPDNTRVPVMVGGTLLEGTEDLGVSFVLDLTERQRAELERDARRAAEAANRAKSEFLATMSHELRTPLNAILGFAQILERDLTLSARQRQQSAIIRDSGGHLLKLIDDVLDLAKIEAGKVSLELTEVSLRDLLATVREITLVKAREKGLELLWHTAPDSVGGIWADERRLRQVLLNLLANAVRFTDRGWVSLSVTCRSPKRVRFEVRDTGIGIDADHLQKLFQPFEQVGNAERRAAGTGLGLAISRKLVRAMGGDIHVISRPAAGSTFWFELDVSVTASHGRTRESNAVITGYKGARRTVLVVDDVPESRAMLVDLLAPLGLTVMEAENGMQAMSLARDTPPDLVVTDLVMPQMGGRELTRHLRDHPQLAGVPVIIVSASVSAPVEPEWSDLGANEFLRKPVNVEDLLRRIGALLALEWIHESPEDAPGRSLEGLVVPPSDELQLLHRLALEGNMQQIIRWADRVGRDSRYDPFARQVSGLATQYESLALLGFVERHLIDPA